MNLQKKSLARLIFIAALILFTAGLSFAGKAGGAKIEAQLGIRYLNAVPENIRAGAIEQASVVDPAKLAGFGIKAKRGDVVNLVQGASNGLFRVELGTQKKNFSTGETGVLRAY